jgi:NTE family protein
MLGEYTFQEAYERSGRSINISVSPTVRHQKARLLSGYTSPFILVWSASLASCAVPLVFSPVTLMKRSVNGGEEPYMPENRYVDGSVRSDLPIERLMHLYDVNFSIVSQTNPHIVPFVKDSNDGHKPGLASLPYRVLKTELKFHGGLLFDHMRKESRFEIVRQLTGQAYSIMRQRYEGDITIAPDYSMRHYRMMMSNLTPEIVAELMLMGERKTWPKIAMIRAHAKISQTIAACVDRLKRRVEKQEREILARGLSTSDKANRQARAHKKAQSHPQAFPDSES